PKGPPLARPAPGAPPGAGTWSPRRPRSRPAPPDSRAGCCAGRRACRGRWWSCLHRSYQDLRHLGTRELRRGHFAAPQGVADRGPREYHPVVLLVGAGLGGGHAHAAAAVEGVLEHERLDADLVATVVVEDLLRVVGSVIVADAGVVTPDDEMRAAIVLADE